LRGSCSDAGWAAPAERRTICLGFDNFAVRAIQWDARQLVDHAVKLGCQSVFITDFALHPRRLSAANCPISASAWK